MIWIAPEYLRMCVIIAKGFRHSHCASAGHTVHPCVAACDGMCRPPEPRVSVNAVGEARLAPAVTPVGCAPVAGRAFPRVLNATVILRRSPCSAILSPTRRVRKTAETASGNPRPPADVSRGSGCPRESLFVARILSPFGPIRAERRTAAKFSGSFPRA